eukprot:CAMPEP_0198304514 /NCGR_PEP_ID=MMETSP1449-20131203/57442_1 /TAXON_ID=420275 /ORGANISM="Attheya septentrionalis, Strain CCMP2084" /LENGTH=383 /DNA_ID=CAMNT_0044007039 /DNA_START=73 /DNA_END=1224 /DNA_ORIENTATION=+
MFGGGDLFGDLPSAKQQQQPQKQQPTDTNSASKQPQPPATNDNVKAKKVPPSLVSALGNAGMATAFMPMALVRKRKLLHSDSRRVGVAPPPLSTDTHKNTAHIQPLSTIPTTQSHETVNTSLLQPDGDKAVVVNETGKDSNAVVGVQGESEELRKLHDSVSPTDYYDPLQPNDYLTYKEGLENEKHRIALERAAKETLKQQEQMRRQIELERSKIDATGNVEQMVASRIQTSGQGRGRGRGLSNLPAWLVKKQQEEAATAASTGDSNTLTTDKDESQFQDASPATQTVSGMGVAQGRVVVLENMTGVGEVDPELSEEVREECESNGFRVKQISVRDGPHIVRVYVEFISAREAPAVATIFDGRRFGDRRITARLVTNPNEIKQ